MLTWLYNRSGGSVLLVAIWHGTYNIISGTNAASGLLAAGSTTLVIALAATLVGLELRAARHGRRSVLGPRPAALSPSSVPDDGTFRTVPPSPTGRQSTS